MVLRSTLHQFVSTRIIENTDTVQIPKLSKFQPNSKTYFIKVNIKIICANYYFSGNTFQCIVKLTCVH